MSTPNFSEKLMQAANERRAMQAAQDAKQYRVRQMIANKQQQDRENARLTQEALKPNKNLSHLVGNIIRGYGKETAKLLLDDGIEPDYPVLYGGLSFRPMTYRGRHQYFEMHRHRNVWTVYDWGRTETVESTARGDEYVYNIKIVDAIVLAENGVLYHAAGRDNQRLCSSDYSRVRITGTAADETLAPLNAVNARYAAEEQPILESWQARFVALAK